MNVAPRPLSREDASRYATRVTLLGTSGGPPCAGRLTLLTVNGSQYLIDCGEEWGPSYRRCGESTPGYRGA